MKTLVVEDNITNRLLLVELLRPYGNVTAVESGSAALLAVTTALSNHQPFDLICLDILLEGMDGQQILKEIRLLEDASGYPLGNGSKIVMTTALRDKNNILAAFRSACDGYLPKPIDRKRLEDQLRELSLIR
jgi:two-component system chemotaxis response regulator CheY